MLLSLRDMLGYKLEATDGEMGQVSDFLFDQKDWTVRYFMDKTAKLFGKEVLLSTSAVERAAWQNQALYVTVDREAVKRSPEIKLKQILEPGRQRYDQEASLNEHYGWLAYWGGYTHAQHMVTGEMSGAGAGMLTEENAIKSMNPTGTGMNQQRRITQDQTLQGAALQSAEMTFGFKVSTKNGELGYVEDFIVNESNWQIMFMVLDTKKNMNGKKILVAPEAIDWVSWRQKHVSVDMEKEKLAGCPSFKLTFPLKQEYSDMLYEQYECQHFWAGHQT